MRDTSEKLPRVEDGGKSPGAHAWNLLLLLVLHGSGTRVETETRPRMRHVSRLSAGEETEKRLFRSVERVRGVL